MEMADSVAYQHTDGYRNYDGSYELHGIKKLGTDRGHKVPGTPCPEKTQIKFGFLLAKSYLCNQKT